MRTASIQLQIERDHRRYRNLVVAATGTGKTVVAALMLAGLAQQARSECWPAGADWARLKPRLYEHDWVVYAKQPLGGPEAVLEYLGRYTHRVAISNERIVGIEPSEAGLDAVDGGGAQLVSGETCRPQQGGVAGTHAPLGVDQAVGTASAL